MLASKPSPRADRPLVIGITGGIASGKSLVASEWERLGAARIDADRLGHEVLRQPEVIHAARGRWGDAIFSTQGQIDRRRLAEIVFAPGPEGAKELDFLEQLSHPRIRNLLQKQIEELASRPGLEAIVVDAPLLAEAGWNDFCDKIVWVEAPRSVRVARAQTRGWNQNDFDRREARQESLEVKRQLADVVIDNSNSLEDARAQIQRAWQQWIPSTHPID